MSALSPACWCRLTHLLTLCDCRDELIKMVETVVDELPEDEST